MFKVKLIFADRVQLRQAASSCNYGSHTRKITIKNNWIYVSEKGPLFTIGFTLRQLGIANSFDE